MGAQLATLVETSRAVAETSGRREKVARLAAYLTSSSPEETAIAVAYLTGQVRQGRVGVGPAALRDAWPESAAADPTLTLAEVDAALDTLAAVQGPGSQAERQRLLRGLLVRATSAEQEFLARLLYGELRQGALEGVMVEAVARAADVPVAEVRRAHMLTGDLPATARIALAEGVTGLRKQGLRLFRPIEPMLAQPADAVDDALERLGLAALEYKLDGARVQVHRSGDTVRVYTRNLNEVTDAVPELVEVVRTLPVGSLVLDGEAVTLDEAGRPLPFQTTMRRFGRKLDVAALRASLPLSSFFFDVLYLDGETLLDRPAGKRFEALGDVLPPGLQVPRLATADVGEAAAFLERARQAGHEGVMAKALDATYQAGARGQAWLKIKPAHTLDLVVLAAEWGHGRRHGWLSNLHLGARDPVGGGFIMLGKTFKGLTDAMLAWQTEHLLRLEVAREGHIVHVRPELVVEVVFNEVQASSRYPGGVALRFARVKRFRPDKRAEQADTIERVRAIHAA